MYNWSEVAPPLINLNELERLQKSINHQPSYDKKVEAAKTSFAKKPNGLFKTVRTALATIAGDLVRCAYCEDSCADEVEHVRPKDFFPEQTFLWPNFLFVCGPCNGGKGNHYPILVGEAQIDLRSHRKANGVVPPPAGLELFIDPRTEDPLRFLWMDMLAGTFMFSSLYEDDPISNARAISTVDTLRLNREP